MSACRGWPRSTISGSACCTRHCWPTGTCRCERLRLVLAEHLGLEVGDTAHVDQRADVERPRRGQRVVVLLDVVAIDVDPEVVGAGSEVEAEREPRGELLAGGQVD